MLKTSRFLQSINATSSSLSSADAATVDPRHAVLREFDDEDKDDDDDDGDGEDKNNSDEDIIDEDGCEDEDYVDEDAGARKKLGFHQRKKRAKKKDANAWQSHSANTAIIKKMTSYGS